jgi:hypothetical protein
VLLAGAQGEPQGGLAARILGNAYETSGHLPFKGILSRKKSGMRSAESQRNAKALRASHGNIGAEFTWGFKKRKRQQIRCHDNQGAGCMGSLDKTSDIAQGAVGGRVLDQSPKDARREFKGVCVADRDFQAEGLSSSLNEVDILRMAVIGDEKPVPNRNASGIALLDPMAQHHRFGAGRTLIQ